MNEDVIKIIKSRISIDTVVKSYVPLTSVGENYLCQCPFHKGSAKSLFVNPRSQSYICFECGAKGDVIDFVRRINNSDFNTTIKWFCKRYKIDFETGLLNDKINRLLSMNKDAAKYFYENLNTKDGLKCLSYLMGTRHLGKNTIKKYKIGYAPDNWTGLLNHMTTLGYSIEELVDASLVTKSYKTGKYFDFFVDRAMFPFFDNDGNIIGFGGRTLNNEDSRKYLNSKGTICYRKNEFLFSSNFALEKMKKLGYVLLCEGNVDAVSLNQYGFENSVASCGTSLTAEHAALLSKYVKRAVLCYDSDEAGQKATLKAIDILEKAGISVYVLTIEGAKDPDEYLLKYGAENFRTLIKKSIPALVYQIKACMPDNMNSDSGRTQFFHKLYQLVSRKNLNDEQVIQILNQLNI